MGLPRNILVDVHYTLDIREEQIRKIMEQGVYDPDGEGVDVFGAVEDAVKDDPYHYLQYACDEPEVSA